MADIIAPEARDHEEKVKVTGVSSMYQIADI